MNHMKDSNLGLREKMQYKKDWQWSDGYLLVIEQILRQNAMYLLDVQISNNNKDTKQATDMVITVKGGDVAVRVRRPYRDFRDLTIRAWRSSGVKTELTKLKEGFADWYFYGWSDDKGGFLDWMLVDLDKLRQSGLLENLLMTFNTDQTTGFVSINWDELNAHGCLVASSRI